MVSITTQITEHFFVAFIAGNLNVTLAIFSGRPDPEWQILTSDPNYAEIEQLLNVARSGGFVYGVEDMPARLGYKGFLVHDLANKNAEPELIIGPHTGKLQQLLLKTVPDNILSENLRSKISKEIGTGADTAEGQVAPTPSSESTDTSTSSGVTLSKSKITWTILNGKKKINLHFNLQISCAASIFLTYNIPLYSILNSRINFIFI